MNLKEEQGLTLRAQRGDKEAFSIIWDSITPKLFGYLINTTHNKTLAEDLLQTTWLKAAENLPKFEIRSSGISPWLFAIARNECRQHWRKSKHEADYNEVETRNESTDNKSVENKLLVDQILHSLSEEDRELLRLRYIADLPINDIAQILNINFIAARVRLHRALTRAQAAALDHTNEPT